MPLDRLEQRQSEKLAIRFFGRPLPTTHDELKSAYRAAVMRLRPDLANSKANDQEFDEMKKFHTALLEQAPSWAFTDGKPKAQTTDGVSLEELGLGLGPRKNGRDCEECKHKGYIEHEVSGVRRCEWCSFGYAYSQPCLRCNGAGNGPKQKPKSCPTCGGLGTKTFGRAQRCRVCGGLGIKSVGRGTVEYRLCYKCLGTGEIEIFNPVIPKGILR